MGAYQWHVSHFGLQGCDSKWTFTVTGYWSVGINSMDLAASESATDAETVKEENCADSQCPCIQSFRVLVLSLVNHGSGGLKRIWRISCLLFLIFSAMGQDRTSACCIRPGCWPFYHYCLPWKVHSLICSATPKVQHVKWPFLSARFHHDCGADWSSGEGQPRHGHLHHHEPWLRWPLQPPWQPEEAVPQPGHDQARPAAHCPGHALLSRIQAGWKTGQQDCAVLPVSCSDEEEMRGWMRVQMELIQF